MRLEMPGSIWGIPSVKWEPLAASGHRRAMAQLLILNLVAFVAALSFGYTVTAFITQARKKAKVTELTPESNALLRVSAGSAVYRSRFIGETSQGWEFAAPLQRSSYVPLRVDQSLVVEFGEDSERRVFRSRVVSRNAETGTMVMAKPDRIYAVQNPASSVLNASFEGLPYLS